MPKLTKKQAAEFWTACMYEPVIAATSEEEFVANMPAQTLAKFLGLQVFIDRSRAIVPKNATEEERTALRGKFVPNPEHCKKVAQFLRDVVDALEEDDE
jgi:hypothetical protein